jgi:hypothetical protein
VKLVNSLILNSSEYEIPKDIAELCGFSQKKISFETHKELDVFVNQILDKMPDFFSVYKNDAALLKSFDRAFWLRHYR